MGYDFKNNTEFADKFEDRELSENQMIDLINQRGKKFWVLQYILEMRARHTIIPYLKRNK